ncbi:MAG TPA: hypothetical protein PLI56_03970 [Exilispira sp.]|nr:hypothetical protein [Exilispira sp.]
MTMDAIVNMNAKSSCKAWVVSISMGLGHMRAAYALRDLSYNDIQMIGDPSSSSPGEMNLWKNMRNSYELLSRLKNVPIIGNALFSIVDNLQNIPPLYPLRDMSSPSYQTNLIYSYIKKGIGKELYEKIITHPLPVIASYPIAALIFDYYNYPIIYSIVCDAEISRVYVAKDPKKSRIHYLAPTGKSVQRLKQYGVPDERIFLTGFPLPKECLGDESLNVLRNDLAQRLFYLDPENRFWPLHKINVEYFLGPENMSFKNDRIFTITYAVGGAGAYREVGYEIVKSLRENIIKKEVRVNLIAGMKKDVNDYFKEALKDLNLTENDVPIIFSETFPEYFAKFAQCMRTTDILWTKPSELSFYAGLGIPIVMCPPLGSQEVYNKKWLLEIQAGIAQEDPKYTNQWLLDLYRYGRLAESAWDGFLKARKFGTYKIEEIIKTGTFLRETNPLRR